MTVVGAPESPHASPDAGAPVDAVVGSVVGGHRVVRALGAGAMGRVYLAVDETLGREVALKLLPPGAADDEARARFLREARALARVEHPNVVRVFSSGDDGGVAWMALAFVDGDPLSELVGDDGIDEETAAGLCAQAARGLAAVHAVGVIHRDVKPANLLVDDDANVRLVDFGVALVHDDGRGGFATRAGVAVGTPHFMSPEQARGGLVDARSDVWGLGATLWTLLIGRPPHHVVDDDSDLEILARVMRDPVPDVRSTKPDVSAATATLLQQMLALDAAVRPASLDDVARRLEAIADTLARGETPASFDAAAAPAASSSSSAPSSAGPDPRAASVASSSRARLGAAIALAAGAALVGGVVGQRSVQPRVVDRVVDRVVERVVVQPALDPAPVALPVVDATVATTKEPPRPTPDELASAVLDHPDDVNAMRVLLARSDDDGRAAIRIVVATPGPAGDALVQAIGSGRDLAHQDALGPALFSTPSRARALASVAALEALRTDVSLQLLDRAQREHTDKVVRAAAAHARESIFKVEE